MSPFTDVLLSSQVTKDIEKKPRVTVIEYATLKEQHLAEKGMLDGYDEMIIDLGRQLREIAVKRTRPDGTVEPLRDIEPATVEEVVEYETMKEEYLAEKGSLEGYDEMIADIAQQMRELAATGFRFGMDGERTGHPKSDGKKKRRKV